MMHVCVCVCELASSTCGEPKKRSSQTAGGWCAVWCHVWHFQHHTRCRWLTSYESDGRFSRWRRGGGEPGVATHAAWTWEGCRWRPWGWSEPGWSPTARPCDHPCLWPGWRRRTPGGPPGPCLARRYGWCLIGDILNLIMLRLHFRLHLPLSGLYANGAHYEPNSRMLFGEFFLMVIENYDYIFQSVSLEKQNQLVSKNLKCDLLSPGLV